MRRETTVTREVTLSLPESLVSYADAKAAAQRRSRSRVIAEWSAQAREREEEDLAAEGYRFCADEARAFADASLRMVSEAVGGTG